MMKETVDIYTDKNIVWFMNEKLAKVPDKEKSGKQFFLRNTLLSW